MKWQKEVFAALSAVALMATFLLAYTYTGAVLEYYNRPRPEVPTGYTLVAERLIGCDQPFMPEAYGRGYASPEYPEVISVVSYGRVVLLETETGFEPVYSPPLMWVFYPNDGQAYPFSGSTYRIVTLPGEPAEYVSQEELKQRYPRGPCSEGL